MTRLAARLLCLALAAAAAATAARAASFEGLSLDRLSATRDRPLFVPSRRPPPPPAAVAPPPPAPAPVVAEEPDPEPEGAPAPTAALTGVIIGGDVRIAVFQDEDGKPHTVRLGEQIEGWTVADVQPRSITIERDGDQLELKLREPDAPAATSAQ